MPIIDTAYTYYLTTYAPRGTTRYDTHKKSELRNVYNQIVKLNKESPLYKFKNRRDVTKFAIDIKESAQHVRNVVSSLSGSDDIMESLKRRSAVSSDEDIVTARYIGNDSTNEEVEDLDIEVRQLAKPQVNIGNFLKSDRRDLAPAVYSFDLTNNSSGYEFQFSVNQDDTNYTVQNKLANLITNAGIGLNASVITDEDGLSALRIESVATGRSEDAEYLFDIRAGGSANSEAALNRLGIDQVSQEAQNASFLLNGTPHSSYSNTFSVDNTFELTLHGISAEDEPVRVGFKPDAQAVLENIRSLTDAYNSLLATSDKYSDTQGDSPKLRYQIGSSAEAYRNSLSSIGLNRNEDGLLEIDEEKLTDVIESEHPSEQLSVLNDFKRALDSRASRAVLNPMEYVNKVVVTYKNPGKNFSAPYAASLYSGMMMDQLC